MIAPRALLLALALAALAAPLSAARGGPDAGGWMWADSRETGAVDTAIDWPASLVDLAPQLDDDVVHAVPLSFPFTLYGTTSSTAWLSSNGWLGLLDPGGASYPAPQAIPRSTPPGALLAWYWSDLLNGPGTFVRHGASASSHVIWLRGVSRASRNILQVAIELRRNGSIKVVWTVLPDGLSPQAAVGIEDAAGLSGTELFAGGAGAGGFQLGEDFAVLFYPQPRLGCAGAVPLSCGATLSDTTLGAPSTTSAYDCGSSPARGGERVFRIDNPSVVRLDAQISGFGTRDLDLYLVRGSCDPMVDCLWGGGDTVAAPTLGPGTWYLVVDGKTPADDGPFTLSTSCSPISQPIACGATASGATAGVSGIDRYACVFLGLDGPEAFFDFTLAAPQPVRATLGPGAPLDLLLLDPATLAPFQSPCLRWADGTLEMLQLPAGRYLLAVDGPAGSDSAFRLTLDCLPRIPATAIACGQSAVAAPRGASQVESYGCSGKGYFEGEGYYRLSAPTPLLVTLDSPLSSDDDILAFREVEAPGNCTAMGDSSLRLLLPRAEDYLFVLDAATPSPPPELSLSCAPFDPAPLACNSNASARTAPADWIRDYDCLRRAADGGEMYFTLSNPVTQDIAVGLWGVGGSVDLDVAILDPAGPTDLKLARCLAGGDRIAFFPSAPPGDYLVTVDGRGAAFDVPFSISAACGPMTTACTGVPELTCGGSVPGDTTTGSNSSYVYAGEPEVWSGPELIYHFFNPVAQTVSFLLRDPSDPRLDLVLLRSCDPRGALDSGDSALVEYNLAPGDYWIVVDGREAAAGSFELMALCGGSRLDPPSFTATLAPGQCASEAKELRFAPSVGPLDVVFSLDLSSSMDATLPGVKAQAPRLYSAVAPYTPSLGLGVASFVEYDRCYTDTVCGGTSCPGAVGAYPFRVDQPITTSSAVFDAALGALAMIGGGKETYTRALWEATRNAGLGYRDCSRRLWLSFGDELPVDCDVYACIGASRSTGRDPGPDLLTGTADDIELLPAVDAMLPAHTSLFAFDSSGSTVHERLWQCLAGRTGGRAVATARDAALPPEVDIDRELRVAALRQRTCPRVELVAAGPQAAWLTASPAAYPAVTPPFFAPFTATWCVPPGTPAGSYSIPVEARCAGGGPCDAALLGTQQVRIDVTTACPVSPVAQAAPPASVCLGQPLVLDGGASSACDASGLEYRWLDGATPLCNWSLSPSCAVPALPGTRVYTLEVRCVSQPLCAASTSITVSPVLPPAAAAGTDAVVCENDPLLLDGSASTASSCPAGVLYEWRDGPLVVRPASPVPTWTPPTAAAGTAVYTLVVSCAAVPGCAASDDVAVTVQDCTIAVAFGRHSARRERDGTVLLEWETLSESGTIGFTIERAAGAASPFTPVSAVLAAQGALRPYRWRDGGAPGGALWYRIVEQTDHGAGDRTGAIAVAGAAGSGAARRRAKEGPAARGR